MNGKRSKKPTSLFASRKHEHNISVDNSTKPFHPKLTYKPNALEPLNLQIRKTENGTEHYAHPYAFELESFSLQPSQLAKGCLIEPMDLSQTSLDIIETKNQLQTMIAELKCEHEIGVDVEEYNYHSYQGLTCLVQISTRQKDYIIDAIALRDDLHELNVIFTDPNIIKVLHCADGDVVWLQRDLSLYIVNMFDTYVASVKLEFPKRSLVGLMEYYCKVTTKKTRAMQLADWRIRPLSEELCSYALKDTHYLLFIFDRLRQDLLDKGKGDSELLEDVYGVSTNICKRTYEKPARPTTIGSYFGGSKRTLFNNRQLYVLNELFKWRDEIAREKDESCGAVLPRKSLYNIAEKLPIEERALFDCCSMKSCYLTKHAGLLCGFSLTALQQPLEEAERKKPTEVAETEEAFSTQRLS